MTLFSISDISKTHEETLLFSNISFGMEDGERVGLIGRNGAGKSTLLRIIAGVESHDTGTVARNSSIHYMFLDQAPLLTYSGTALHAVVEGKPRLNALLQRHAELCHADDRSPQLDEELHEISYQID
ncbi:MAG: ABC-F family ATP-binding cassette domain-containing protein, partial [Candidatus Kapabacteria bacterium]|nr:ABC-F family ATP-binding cassette domain-containing protein [Candidatus Kapabacteria bacterium]